MNEKRPKTSHNEYTTIDGNKTLIDHSTFNIKCIWFEFRVLSLETGETETRAKYFHNS